jgi:glycerol transport system ATP-binding protein
MHTKSKHRRKCVTKNSIKSIGYIKYQERRLQLSLHNIKHQVGAQPYLYDMNLVLQPGALTVLLGTTLSGKTTLMRIMAGLDKPTHGQVMVDGKDVTGMPVRERNVAMVYQQFINYPSIKVYDNIASPLKLRKQADIKTQVTAMAQKLHIDHLLDRLPAELSGGQQQRVALARALIKGAPLMLLDEPLVNLDYKLREELREELSSLFALGNSAVVYATTEPAEALLLGGYTAVLDAGKLLQYGPTAEVFHQPASLRVAKAFSDPPINLIAGEYNGASIDLADSMQLPIAWPNIDNKHVTVGIRASALKLQGGPNDYAIAGKVILAEISGSDTFVHLATTLGDLVAQFTGVHFFDLDTPLTVYVNPKQCYVFGHDEKLLVAAQRRGGL